MTIYVEYIDIVNIAKLTLNIAQICEKMINIGESGEIIIL